MPEYTGIVYLRRKRSLTVGLKNRISDALAAGQAAVAEAEADAALRRPRSFGLLALGPDWRDAPDIEGIEGFRRTPGGLRRILITDSAALPLYQIDGWTTEHLPAVDDTGDLRQMVFAARRFELVVQKWGIERGATFDPDTAEHLKRLRQHAPGLNDWSIEWA